MTLPKISRTKAKRSCIWCGQRTQVLKRALDYRTKIDIGCESCVAVRAASLLLMGFVEGASVATADLLHLSAALIAFDSVREHV